LFRAEAVSILDGKDQRQLAERLNGLTFSAFKEHRSLAEIYREPFLGKSF
jgi:hypothetical protein